MNDIFSLYFVHFQKLFLSMILRQQDKLYCLCNNTERIGKDWDQSYMFQKFIHDIKHRKNLKKLRIIIVLIVSKISLLVYY